MKIKSRMTQLILSLTLATSVTFANADGFKPFVLGSATDMSVEQMAVKVKEDLVSQGFEVVGSYKPNMGTSIVVITNNDLQSFAKATENGGFGATQRVSISSFGGKTEVAYTNPGYILNMYRMEGDMSATKNAMQKALGSVGEFGSDKSYTLEELRGYQYKFMMPYFDDVDELASYDSHEEALNAVSDGLAQNKAGVSQVYRIDLTDTVSVFGVAITTSEGADKTILSAIDKGEHSHAAHFPYEILVSGDDIIALNAKFRIAMSWPSLSMMGKASFMSIADAPYEIEQILTTVVSKD